MNKLIAIILITLGTTTFAQEKAVKNILNKLSSTTKSYKNMTISFELISENINQKIKEIQEIDLIIENEKFQLTMKDKTIINDGKSQWVYLKEMNEVQIMEHDPENSMMSPNHFFAIYEEDYKYTYIGAESKKGSQLEIIDFFPKERKNVIKITLAINAAKNQLERITIHDKNGGTYTCLIKSFKNNTLIKPLTFNVTDFPGVEVIDLR